MLWVQMHGEVWLCCLQSCISKEKVNRILDGFGSRVLVLYCTMGRGDEVDAQGGCVQVAKQNSRISYGIQNHPKHSRGEGEPQKKQQRKQKAAAADLCK